LRTRTQYARGSADNLGKPEVFDVKQIETFADAVAAVLQGKQLFLMDGQVVCPTQSVVAAVVNGGAVHGVSSVEAGTRYSLFAFVDNERRWIRREPRVPGPCSHRPGAVRVRPGNKATRRDEPDLPAGSFFSSLHISV